MSLKRLCISTAAAALLAVGVAACGGDTETVTVRRRPAATRVRPAAPSNGETVKIIASVPPTDHGWLGAISKNAKSAADAHDDVDFELLAGGRRGLAGPADRAGDREEARRARRAAPGRRGAHAGRPEGRGGRHPGRQHRPALHHARRRHRHDPRRQLPDRRAGGRLHRRRAQVQGQRRRDPGPGRHLGHRRTAPRASRTSSRSTARTAASRSSPQQPGDFNPDQG